MITLKDIIEVGIIGIAIAVIFYWLALLINRARADSDGFGWWLKHIVIQGVFVAAALKLLGII